MNKEDGGSSCSVWHKPSPAIRKLFSVLTISVVAILALVRTPNVTASISSNSGKYIPSSAEMDMDEKSAFKDGLRCLEESNSIYGRPKLSLKDFAERNDHFNDLMNRTAIYRKVVTHCWVGYCGPWTEEYFVTILSKLHYSEFGQFVPLFVNWLDIWKNQQYMGQSYSDCLGKIFSMLRGDMLYITVSSHDDGLETYEYKKKVPPNLLIISASGYGHIPFFDLQRELGLAKAIIPSNYSLVFMGTVSHHPHRVEAMDEAQKIFGGKLYSGNTKEDWRNAYKLGKVIFSPRGNALGCFRHSEILQMGFVPFFTSDNYPWVPYLNSNLPWGKMAFFANQNSMKGEMQKIKNLSDNEAEQMRNLLIRYRESHFTPRGAVNQILLFMKGGFTESDLRCTTFEVRGGRTWYN